MNSIKLDANNELFVNLKNDPPQWWLNLLADKDLYFDVRKDNYINAYYNGGSIMKLEFDKKNGNYRAKISPKYVPFNESKNYIEYGFSVDKSIEFERPNVWSLDNFSKKDLSTIKSRIKKSYSLDSEKGTQGNYMTKYFEKNISSGFFIDSEFAWNDADGSSRIDMVWVDIDTKTIYLVELKIMGDARLVGSSDLAAKAVEESEKLVGAEEAEEVEEVEELEEAKGGNELEEVEEVDEIKNKENIKKQMLKYHELAIKHGDGLLKHYNNVYKIKKSLGLLPSWIDINNIVDLEDFRIQAKPILLVNRCTQNWIDKKAIEINKELKGVAFCCIYNGVTNFDFSPNKRRKNVIFNE